MTRVREKGEKGGREKEEGKGREGQERGSWEEEGGRRSSQRREPSMGKERKITTPKCTYYEVLARPGGVGL